MAPAHPVLPGQQLGKATLECWPMTDSQRPRWEAGTQALKAVLKLRTQGKCQQGKTPRDIEQRGAAGGLGSTQSITGVPMMSGGTGSTHSVMGYTHDVMGTGSTHGVGA